MKNQFSIASEKKIRTLCLSASYTLFAASTYVMHDFSTEPLLRSIATISAIALALRHKHASKIPLFLARIFTRALIARDVKKPSERLSAVTKKICDDNQIDFQSIKLFSYNKGITVNAFALGNEVYVGNDLEETLNDKELSFVVAHELSHVINKDASRVYLSSVPYFSSIAPTFILGPALIASGIFAGNTIDLATIAIGSALLPSFILQKPLRGTYSRSVERLADYGALQKTNNDVESAMSAMLKIGDLTEKTKWEKITATHPQGIDRIESLIATHLKINNEEAAKNSKKMDFEITVNSVSLDRSQNNKTKTLPFLRRLKF